MTFKKKEVPVLESEKKDKNKEEAKRLVILLNDYFNGHYRLDAPDLRDILSLLEKI